MSDTGPSRAWAFLRRNPVYIEDRQRAAAQPAPAERAPFPLRRQTEGDLEAAAWGLLAWEDPLDGAGPARGTSVCGTSVCGTSVCGTSVSPFWTEAPTLEAMPAPGAPALTELLGVEGAGLSGLRLRDGAAVVKVECSEASVQIRIADGAAFDPAGGVDLMRLSPAADLQERLHRVARLWPIAEAETKKAGGSRSWTRSFSSRSTAGSPAAATA